jgi:hypothetical protein
MRNMMGMRLKPLGSRAVVSALAALGLAAALRADLAPASPFLPANSPAAAGAAAAAGPIELRGLMPTPDGYAYCIYDTAKKKSVWVGLNETGHDFVVRSSAAGSDSVKVDYQGRTMTLTLKEAKVTSAGIANSEAPPVMPGRPGPGNPGLPNMNPGDEQKRLDAVAQEVRRRRQEREKAAQAAQGGQALPPPAPAGR